tara:strand:- start:112 stop:354 length:243 start_codon:yes stop_codon:yes gene_type:complete
MCFRVSDSINDPEDGGDSNLEEYEAYTTPGLTYASSGSEAFSNSGGAFNSEAKLDLSIYLLLHIWFRINERVSVILKHKI